jgi:hypothetical protein
MAAVDALDLPHSEQFEVVADHPVLASLRRFGRCAP